MSVDPEKRSCLFLRFTHDRFQFSEMAGNLLFEGPRMAKLEWRFDDQKMGKVGLYCAPPSPTLTHPLTSCAMAPMLATGLYIADAPSFLDHWFSGLNTPAVDKFVCKTMRDSCPDMYGRPTASTASVSARRSWRRCRYPRETISTSTATRVPSPRAENFTASVVLHCALLQTPPHYRGAARRPRAQAIVPQVACGLRRNKR